MYVMLVASLNANLQAHMHDASNVSSISHSFVLAYIYSHGEVEITE